MKIWPPKECPRFKECSVNHCPLDPKRHWRKSIPGDKERKCPMEKRVRYRIGCKYAAILKDRGLTPSEVAGAKLWSKLSEFQQWTIRERARERARKLNAKRQSKSRRI